MAFKREIADGTFDGTANVLDEPHLTRTQDVDAQIRAAVAREREACIQVVEDLVAEDNFATAADAAVIIRQRCKERGKA